MFSKITLAVLCVLLVKPASAKRTFTNGWVTGRATFFGRDAWSLHIGSCGYGFVCPNRWTNEGLEHGYDLVAISDQSPLFHGHRGDQCGQCLEVRCRSAVMHDRYGERLARTSQCKSKKGASVKVKIVDTCDCKYGPNSASNARWCCGDRPHLDLSQWALDKLVKKSEKWGVFAISYRTVPCDNPVAKKAKKIGIVRDPHEGMRGDTNCNAQGGYSTQSRKKSRARAKSGRKHSAKFYYRAKLMKRAGWRRRDRKFRARLDKYLKQFSKGMRKVNNRGIKKPYALRV